MEKRHNLEYIFRALHVWEFACPYYEPGNQARSLKQVWRRFVKPRMGICYRTFLNYKKAAEEWHEAEPRD